MIVISLLGNYLLAYGLSGQFNVTVYRLLVLHGEPSTLITFLHIPNATFLYKHKSLTKVSQR